MDFATQTTTNYLTLLLAITTVWLGYATHSMAKSTREAVEIQSQPYFSIDGFDIETGQITNIANSIPDSYIRLILLFSNPGNVLVNYEIEDINITFENNSILNPNLMKRNIIHPKGNKKFLYPPILQVGAIKPGSGEIKLKISYWATLYKVHHVDTILKCEVLTQLTMNGYLLMVQIIRRI